MMSSWSMWLRKVLMLVMCITIATGSAIHVDLNQLGFKTVVLPGLPVNNVVVPYWPIQEEFTQA